MSAENHIENYGISFSLSDKIIFYDESGSIGRRYARADEVGIFFSLTVDHQTLKDGTVTLRERDSKNQSRLSIEDALSKVGR